MDEPHENEGIAFTDYLYDILEDIKEFYEIDLSPNEIKSLIIDKEIEIDSLKEIVNFIESIFKINTLPFEFDSWINDVKDILDHVENNEE